MEELVYVSSAVEQQTDAELEALLTRARERNQRLGLTGVLLYDDGDFFQYLEGPAAALDEVWGLIVRAPQHRSILQLVRGPIAARNFGRWSMGFVKVPKSALLQLAQADWRTSLATAPDPGRATPGIELLQHFWRQHRVRRPA